MHVVKIALTIRALCCNSTSCVYPLDKKGGYCPFHVQSLRLHVVRRYIHLHSTVSWIIDNARLLSALLMNSKALICKYKNKNKTISGWSKECVILLTSKSVWANMQQRFTNFVFLNGGVFQLQLIMSKHFRHCLCRAWFTLKHRYIEKWC